MKFVPRFNDGVFVQHADDQINDGTGTGASHENIRTPIGAAIESYQGFKTVELFKGTVLLYSERPCEELKYITWAPIATGLVTLTFRLRSETGSAHYLDFNQYVYIALHTTCGTEGA